MSKQNLEKAKETIAARFRKTWSDIHKDYEYGLGISKLMGIEELMEMVAEEYKNQAIPKKELKTLRRSIHSADIMGEELVIKGLAAQLDKILNLLEIKHKTELIDLRPGAK